MSTARRGQTQDAGDHSTNYQGGRDVHVYGLSIDEARTVAIDVFKANAMDLAGDAKALAVARAEQLTHEFLAKLEAEMPERASKLADPDVQGVVFEAQREFARSGEEDLRVALVDLLAERISEDDRNLRTLALNEAIASAPKLTEKQRRAIAWVFYLKYTRIVGVGTPEAYYSRIERDMSALGFDVPTGHADYQHIEYVGAGSLSIATTSFAKAIMSGVEGLYTTGFAVTDVDADLLAELRARDFVIPALRDRDRLQLQLLADDDLVEHATIAKLLTRVADLKTIVALGRMSEDDVASEVLGRVPQITTLHDAWENQNTGLSSLTLTSVGLALGHAYWSRATGGNSPLKIWLP